MINMFENPAVGELIAQHAQKIERAAQEPAANSIAGVEAGETRCAQSPQVPCYPAKCLTLEAGRYRVVDVEK